MRKGLLWLLGAWLFVAGPLVAQTPLAPEAAPPPTPGAAPANTPGDKQGDKPSAAAEAPKTQTPAAGAAKAPECVGPVHYWARAEYLLWWLKGAPLPVPLVSTGD